MSYMACVYLNEVPTVFNPVFFRTLTDAKQYARETAENDSDEFFYSVRIFLVPYGECFQIPGLDDYKEDDPYSAIHIATIRD